MGIRKGVCRRRTEIARHIIRECKMFSSCNRYLYIMNLYTSVRQLLNIGMCLRFHKLTSSEIKRYLALKSFNAKVCFEMILHSHLVILYRVLQKPRCAYLQEEHCFYDK